MYQYKAVVKRVIDGDTMELTVDLGFYVSINIRVRVLDVDTYETKGEYKDYGLKIKEATDQLLTGKQVIIETKATELSSKTDKYGRWLCNVRYDDGKDLKEWIEAHNYNKWSKDLPIFD